jgi:putative endonuclease
VNAVRTEPSPVQSLRACAPPRDPSLGKTWRAYLLRCGDGSLYAGVTTDPAARLAAHACGRGARYTRSRGAVALAWVSPALDKRAAHRLEARLKRLPRADKLVLASEAGTQRRRLVRTLLAAARAG